MGEGGLTFRPAWAEVDLDALAHNLAVLGARADPAVVCAVVKADGYGHGAVPVARASLDAGAAWLAVALVEEGVALREAGIEAPVLLLSEAPPEAAEEVLARDLTPTVYSLEAVEALARAARARGRTGLAVHLKVDTGMHRVGIPPDGAVAVAEAVLARPELALGALWSHFAVADEPDRDFTDGQARRFDEVVARLGARGIRAPLHHLCNSAGVLAHERCHRDLVRCGIALYGVAPSRRLEGTADLRPVLRLAARVTSCRRVTAGEGISYGLNYRPARPATVATVPLGYADGVPWALARGGEVLVRGVRRPIAGNVTMDQLMVDCGDDPVAVGEEVVLLGRQGAEEVTAWEWAERGGTIAYEVLTGLGARVPRRLVATGLHAGGRRP